MTFFKKRTHMAGFSFTILLIAIFVVSYGIYDYRRLTAQVESSMINNALNAAATLQTFARAGLSGGIGLNPSIFKDAVKDTCYFTHVDWFGFVDSSNQIIKICKDSDEIINDPQLIEAANNLSSNKYTHSYSKDNFLVVTTRLDLDKRVGIGNRTARFYKLIFRKGRNARVIKEIKQIPQKKGLSPIIFVGQSTKKYTKFRVRSTLRQILFGLILFILVSAFIYVSIIRQNQKTLYTKLKETRHLNTVLNQKLRYADRMAVFGRLSAAMAHELRNPLGSIRGFIQLFKKHSIENNDQKLISYGDTVISEVDRLNNLITSMLNYSSPTRLQLEACSLPSVIDNVIRLIQRDANSKSVVIKKSIPAFTSQLQLDKNMITQTFLNLLINAIESMKNGGTITITAMQQNDKIITMIADTGSGIEDSVLTHIFEPFFTTKPSGTGLGLANVEKIITEHGGSIYAKSVVGQGSTFYIELPRNMSNE